MIINTCLNFMNEMLRFRNTFNSDGFFNNFYNYDTGTIKIFHPNRVVFRNGNKQKERRLHPHR
ncbi:MAG: hypothetical protein JWP81_5231 [Ferruginibacter sp.]|nr:hypothetical protein [Ferruginibacter sp.]